MWKRVANWRGFIVNFRAGGYSGRGRLEGSGPFVRNAVMYSVAPLEAKQAETGRNRALYSDSTAVRDGVQVSRHEGQSSKCLYCSTSICEFRSN
jgi:hypothetical protein